MQEVTRQQATQAESQLQELQQQRSHIQVQACPTHHFFVLRPSGGHQLVPVTLGRRYALPRKSAF